MNLNADSSANVNDDCENDSEDYDGSNKTFGAASFITSTRTNSYNKHELPYCLILLHSLRLLRLFFAVVVFCIFVVVDVVFLICSFFFLFGQYAIGGMTNAESFKCRTSFESILLRFRVRREVDKKDFGTMIS